MMCIKRYVAAPIKMVVSEKLIKTPVLDYLFRRDSTTNHQKHIKL